MLMKIFILIIAKKYLNFIILFMILIFSSNIIAATLVIPFDKKKHGKGLFKKEKKLRKSIKKDKNENILSEKKKKKMKRKMKMKKKQKKLKNYNIEEEKLKNSNKELKKKKKDNYMKVAIKSKRVRNFFLMGMFMTPLENFINSAWRNIAVRNNIPAIFNPFVLIIYF